MRPNTLHTDDGLLLRLHNWPLQHRARGTVLIVHGLGEHAGRYAHVAAHLNAAGWNARGYDQRGHGGSGGAHGALRRADDLLQDLSRVIDLVSSTMPGPLVLLGHSMGGLVVGRFVAEGLSNSPAPWWRQVDGLVMSSPALAADLGTGQRALLTVLERVAPHQAVHNGLQPEWISRDPAVVSAYKTDPLGHDRITARLARFITDSGLLVRSRAARWRTPTLLMWAGADRCVAPRGSEEFAGAAPASLVRSRVWPALHHEIFNEPEQDEVLAELGIWLARHRSSGFKVAVPTFE